MQADGDAPPLAVFDGDEPGRHGAHLFVVFAQFLFHALALADVADDALVAADTAVGGAPHYGGQQTVEPAPVAGDEDDLEVADEPVALDLLLVAGAVFGIGVDGADVHAEELGMGPGEQLAGRVVGVENGPVALRNHHGVVGLLEQLAILLPAQPPGGPLTLLLLLLAHQNLSTLPEQDLRGCNPQLVAVAGFDTG